ncbi:MAG: hypothetical protein MUF48_08605 [Pirellulaceae bacterium]|jgi:cell division protein FtsB|nr:hypothetical protein [Pirellulaceae bacterium]
MNLTDLPQLLWSMLNNHPFWATLTLAVLLWYSSVTVYVGIRGVLDIKQMLRNLAAQEDDRPPEP